MLFKLRVRYTLILLHARMYACIHMDKGHKKCALTYLQIRQGAMINSSRRFYKTSRAISISTKAMGNRMKMMKSKQKSHRTSQSIRANGYMPTMKRTERKKIAPQNRWHDGKSSRTLPPLHPLSVEKHPKHIHKPYWILPNQPKASTRILWRKANESNYP